MPPLCIAFAVGVCESWKQIFRYPTECSGPPHLLGPWGRPVGDGKEWPPQVPSSRPATNLKAPVRSSATGAFYCAKTKKSRPEAARFFRNNKILLDLGFLEVDMLAHDGVILLEGQLFGLRASVLGRHVEETGVGSRQELDLDIGGLGHGSDPE